MEAAAALTIAYLALEILWLPQAGMRWMVVMLLGAFHGLYFALFLAGTGYRPWFVLSGAALAELAFTVLFGLFFAWLRRRLANWKPVPVSASLLLATGLAWFLVRLRS